MTDEWVYLFGPELVLPEQFFSDVRMRCPERRFLVAFLGRNLLDFYNETRTEGVRRDSERRRIRSAAQNWLFERNLRCTLPLEAVCEHLELDPAWLRGILLRWKAQRHRNGRVSRFAPGKYPRARYMNDPAERPVPQLVAAARD